MFIYLSLLLLAHPSSGIPLTARLVGNDTASGNGTAVSPPSWWVPGGSGRGTYSLISSCLLTLVLCAWTAYHPNIPAKVSAWALIGRRMRWVLVAVFGPELVIVVACSQLHAAWRLKTEVNSTAKILEGRKKETMAQLYAKPCVNACSGSSIDASRQPKQLTGSRTWPCKNNAKSSTTVARLEAAHKIDFNYPKAIASTPWTLSQAFFALSGGIAVEADSFYPVKRLTFEPKAIVILARLGILPELGVQDVNDKSKADIFAKSLVCIQVGWFIIQSIARLQQNLPLTLLEIHTNTHIICAFIMYAVWATKPYDVGAPIFSTDQRVVDMAAFFASNTFEDVGGQLIARLCTTSAHITPEYIESAHRHPVRGNPGSKSYTDGWKDACCWMVPRKRRCRKVDPRRTAEHLMRANRAINRMKEVGYHANWGVRAQYTGDVNDEPGLRSVFFLDSMVAEEACTFPDSSLDASDMLASQALSQSSPTSTGVSDAKRPHKVAHRDIPGNIVEKIFENRFSIDDKSHLRTWVLIAISGLYGGAHLSAWNSHFPTTVEMWMWRIGGICLAAGPLAAGVLRLSSTLNTKVYEASKRAKENGKKSALWSTLGWMVSINFYVVFLICSQLIILYGAARLFIVAEAFASLRSPAPGTYQTVHWVAYLPHAS